MLTGRILRHFVLAAWSAVCLLPLYWVAIGSFKSARDVANGPAFLPFVDFQPTLNAWLYILFDSGVDTLGRFANSLAVASFSTILTLLLGGMAAFSVVRWRGSRFWQHRLMVAVLATRILPPIIVATPIYLMMNAIGGVDTWWALVIVYTTTNLPLALWLLRDGFADLSPDILDAAEIDGASFVSVFFTMAVPLARASIIATGMLVFILSWNEFTLAVLLTTDHALTLPPYLAGQMAVRKQMATAGPQWDFFCVLIMLMTTPLIAGTTLPPRLLTGAFVRAPHG